MVRRSNARDALSPPLPHLIVYSGSESPGSSLEDAETGMEVESVMASMLIAAT